VKSIGALTKTFVPERPGADGKALKVEVDDAFVSIVEFDNGAIGTLEASRFAAGNKNGEFLEINGELGSIRFGIEKMNELDVFWVGAEPKAAQGWTTVMVGESFHPWMSNWWPMGHIIGWEHTFVHELTHFLDCIVNKKPVAPLGADFEDGYRNACICDAILESAATRRIIDVKY
jgi:predicted dehydrogenase